MPVSDAAWAYEVVCPTCSQVLLRRPFAELYTPASVQLRQSAWRRHQTVSASCCQRASGRSDYVIYERTRSGDDDSMT